MGRVRSGRGGWTAAVSCSEAGGAALLQLRAVGGSGGVCGSVCQCVAVCKGVAGCGGKGWVESEQVGAGGRLPFLAALPARQLVLLLLM